MAVIKTTKQTIDTILRGDKPVLAEFWAPWCTYCRRIGAAYQKLSEQQEGVIETLQINVDEEPELEERFGIELIPTFILFHQEKELGRLVAPDSKARIEAFLKEHLG